MIPARVTCHYCSAQADGSLRQFSVRTSRGDEMRSTIDSPAGWSRRNVAGRVAEICPDCAHALATGSLRP